MSFRCGASVVEMKSNGRKHEQLNLFEEAIYLLSLLRNSMGESPVRCLKYRHI